MADAICCFSMAFHYQYIDFLNMADCKLYKRLHWVLTLYVEKKLPWADFKPYLTRTVITHCQIPLSE
jgi:hypothetical protein